MSDRPKQLVFLARHGETEWTRTGRHTGRTDLPLTERGEREAAWLRERLASREFSEVFTSPLQRAARTCELAGFAARAAVDADLLEWDYGDYEGRTRAEILARSPDWRIFRDGCPGGESPAQVAARADRVAARARAAPGDVLLFSSAHILRVVAARWLGLPPTGAGQFVLATASLSALGYEHDRTEPVVRLWNEIPPPR